MATNALAIRILLTVEAIEAPNIDALPFHSGIARKKTSSPSHQCLILAEADETSKEKKPTSHANHVLKVRRCNDRESHVRGLAPRQTTSIDLELSKPYTTWLYQSAYEDPGWLNPRR